MSNSPMSTAALGTAATIAVFVLTYAGVALGRAPGLRIDRAGIALVGASLMIGLGSLSLSDALKAIDLDAIALLLGMMIIVSQLRVSGFYELSPFDVKPRRNAMSNRQQAGERNGLVEAETEARHQQSAFS